MTSEQAEKIRDMREDGLGCARIGQMLGISKNTVSSFCRSNGLKAGDLKEAKKRAENGEHYCRCCGKPVEQNPGRKEKMFCSDACRMKWWNRHLYKVNRKAYYEFTCKYCGKTFTAYGNANRKYCCHECYIADRYGVGRYDDQEI